MSDKPTIDELRTRIDNIDVELLALLNQRIRLAQSVGHNKSTQGQEVYRADREAQIISGLVARNSGPLEADQVSFLFREIISIARRAEGPLTVALLGPAGTYSETAALKQFGHQIERLEAASVDEVFRLTESGSATFGVVPVENSTEGGINTTLDRLLETTLVICGEIELRIEHCLLGHSGGQVPRLVMGHQQALAQCRHWLDSHYPNVPRIAASSNAQAAMMAMEDGKTAAIAGEIAAQIYELDILARNIEDQVDNTTRFIIVGREDVAPSGCDKTSIMVSMENKPGALFRVLEPFHRSGVSLTSIETRPSNAGRWSYVFFIDFEGHASDQNIQDVLKVVDCDALEVKLLGSYPRALRV